MRIRLVVALVAVAALAGLAASAPAAGAVPEQSKPKLKVLILGDSVGQGLGKEALEQDKRVEVVNAATVNCTISGGADSLQSYKDGSVIGSGCPNWRTEWPALVQQNQPDVVLVWTGGWEIVDRWFANPGVGLPSTIEQPEFQQQLSQATKDAATLLSATGAKVVFTTMQYINPPHAYPEPPGTNGIEEIWWEAYGPDAPPPGYNAPLPGQPFLGSKHKVDDLNKIRLDLGRQGAINVYDLNKLVSPKGVFTTKYRGKNIRFTDDSHFNAAGYKIVANWLVPKLQKLTNK
ncbi:MAG TPA: SGNH/GDSL hydrolase family protein [Acidimicrobiia bacterium]|nr:SGNH/GDSL hydrolase family protein [Acidimicrobiia bacterium]